MDSQQKRQACVLEVNTSEVIAVTNDGEFVTLPLQGKAPQIGDIISLESSKNAFFSKSITRFIAVAAMFVLMFIPYLTSAKAVMWVSMDVNPSIEFGLDKEMRVVETEAINEDAKRVLDNVNIDNIYLDEAIPLIVEEMQKGKYISPEKENVIMIAFTSQEGYQSLEDQTATKVAKIMNEIKEVRKVPLKGVYYSKGKINERKLAHNKKLSFGKYLLYKKAQAKGININIDDLVKLPAAKAVLKAGSTMRDILPPNVKIEVTKTVYGKVYQLKQDGNFLKQNKKGNKKNEFSKSLTKETKKEHAQQEKKETNSELSKKHENKRLENKKPYDTKLQNTKPDEKETRNTKFNLKTNNNDNTKLLKEEAPFIDTQDQKNIGSISKKNSEIKDKAENNKTENKGNKTKVKEEKEN